MQQTRHEKKVNHGNNRNKEDTDKKIYHKGRLSRIGDRLEEGSEWEESMITNLKPL